MLKPTGPTCERRGFRACTVPPRSDPRPQSPTDLGDGSPTFVQCPVSWAAWPILDTLPKIKS